MAIITQIETLEDALATATALEQAATATLAEIQHEPIGEGAVARFLERAFDEAETTVWTAREGEAVVGVCMTGVWVAPLSLERMAIVLALFVQPDHRHQGVARALVAAAREALEGRGVRRLGARVEHNDDARISMGERWGWTRGWEWMDSGDRS